MSNRESIEDVLKSISGINTNLKGTDVFSETNNEIIRMLENPSPDEFMRYARTLNRQRRAWLAAKELFKQGAMLVFMDDQCNGKERLKNISGARSIDQNADNAIQHLKEKQPALMVGVIQSEFRKPETQFELCRFVLNLYKFAGEPEYLNQLTTSAVARYTKVILKNKSEIESMDHNTLRAAMNLALVVAIGGYDIDKCLALKPRLHKRAYLINKVFASVYPDYINGIQGAIRSSSVDEETKYKFVREAFKNLLSLDLYGQDFLKDVERDFWEMFIPDARFGSAVLEANEHMNKENSYIQFMRMVLLLYTKTKEGMNMSDIPLFIRKNFKFADEPLQQNETLAEVIRRHEHNQERECDCASDISECFALSEKGVIPIRKLGSGDTGTVYLAYHEVYDTRIAIKFVLVDELNKRPDGSSEPPSQRGIEDKKGKYDEYKEAAFLFQLDHPNIVKVKGAYRRDIKGKDHIVLHMEYLQGDQLKKVISRHPKGLPLEKVINYSGQLLDGIYYLRSKGIFHRDIKTTNVMLTPEDNIKICDFGYSVTDLHAPLMSRRRGREVNKKYGGETDAFAWGLLTYELLAGDHFVVERRHGMGSRTHKSEVLLLKGKIRDDNGRLKPGYKSKVDNLGENVPQYVKDAIVLALENTSDITAEERFAKIVNLYNSVKRVV